MLASVTGGEILKAHGAGDPTMEMCCRALPPFSAQLATRRKTLSAFRRMHDGWCCGGNWRSGTRQAEPGGFVPMGQVERMLSQAFADVPGAVNTDRNTLTVTIPDPPHRALDRLATIGSADCGRNADCDPAASGPGGRRAAQRPNRPCISSPGRVQRPGNDGKAI